jgi:hypothetical protein
MRKSHPESTSYASAWHIASSGCEQLFENSQFPRSIETDGNERRKTSFKNQKSCMCFIAFNTRRYKSTLQFTRFAKFPFQCF